MPKNRVLHARITDDTHSKLTQKCSELGCSITDYVTNILDDSFDEPVIEPEPQRPKISFDEGKTWHEC